jgi:putative PIN family toxin of toxin-antitoxin system
LFDELADVMSRPRIRRKYLVPPEDIEELRVLLLYVAEQVNVSGSVHICRDPNDDILIETAIEGKADVLVSRDEDLTRDLEVMAVMSTAGVRVLTVRHFLAELGLADPL